MITNILGGFWGTQGLINLRNNLPTGFELKLYKLNHKCVKNQDITFKERFVNEIVLRYGEQFVLAKLDNADIPYISKVLTDFIEEHSPKTQQPKNIDELRIDTIEAVKNVLNINNDVVFYDDKQMSFELNLYAPSERKRIIALLSVVDEFVPEVFVNINLNNSTIEELNALNDRLLEAEILS